MAAVAIDSVVGYQRFGESGHQEDVLKPVISEAKLGGRVFSTHFIKELEKFYNNAETHDKAKCLELITSVRLDEGLKRHIKKLHHFHKARPNFRCTTMLDSYQTSYERDYPPKVGQETWALRPMTSVGYVTSMPDSKPPGPTEYDVEYCRKFQRPASPERAATASGERNNRPHPSKSFLVWKFPNKNRYNSQDGGEVLPEDLTNEKLKQITKRQCHSVYQNDYLGIPQGFQVNSAFNLPTNWKDNVPYGMNSSQRRTYQLPHQQQELVVPTTRYGSNTLKQVPAGAVIPTANKRQIDVGDRTTYDRHYNDNAGLVIEQIRDAGRKLAAQTFRTSMRNPEHEQLLMEFKEPHGVIQPPQRATYPTPPSSLRSMSVPATAQRHRVTSPLENGYKFSQHPSTNHMAEKVCSANRPHPSVPPATPIKLPSNSPYHVQMPSTPFSVPYTPPLFLS